MPIVTIEAPAKLPLLKKRKLVHQINAALTNSYAIKDNVILLREYSRGNVAIAGVLQSKITGSKG